MQTNRFDGISIQEFRKAFMRKDIHQVLDNNIMIKRSSQKRTSFCCSKPLSAFASRPSINWSSAAIGSLLPVKDRECNNSISYLKYREQASLVMWTEEYLQWKPID